MNWIFLALLAPAIYSVVNFVDKYVVEHKVKDSRGMPLYGAITAAIFGASVWLIAGMPTIHAKNASLLLISGIITMFGFALYFRALEISQTSYIIGLLQTTPVFVLVLSAIFLHESLTLLQFLGFLMIFCAALMLSVDKVEKKIRLTRAFYYIIIANILFAIGAIVIKFTVDLNGLVPILVYESWGLAIGGAVLAVAFVSIRRAFIKSFRSVGSSTLAIMFLNESLFVISKSITFYAISLGPVALVSVLSGTQVFYGILYGLVLTLMYPRIFHEDIARQDLWRKILLSGMLFLGIGLIGLG